MHHTRTVNFVMVAAIVLTATATGTPAAAQDPGQAWQPIAPDGLPTDFDWIRLPSDEWLKGEIVSMYDGELEFDSDELGVLTFDFEDLKELRSSRILQVGFEDRDPASGRLMMDADAARVTGGANEAEFDRSEILTLVVGSPKEINYWSAYAHVGGNIRSGNTDQVDYTARLGTMRRSVRDRATFDYLGNLTKINSEETSNNHRATAGWDHFVSKRLYVNVIGAEWYRDPFQNVANRWTLTAGLGFQILDTDRTSWSVGAGPAWQSTEWKSVALGDDDTSSSLALRIGTDVDIEMTDAIDFYTHYNAFFTDSANGTYTHHFDTGLSFELIGDLDFNVAWVWDHIQDPRPLEDGSFPDQDDTRLTFGLGWNF